MQGMRPELSQACDRFLLYFRHFCKISRFALRPKSQGFFMYIFRPQGLGVSEVGRSYTCLNSFHADKTIRQVTCSIIV